MIDAIQTMTDRVNDQATNVRPLSPGLYPSVDEETYHAWDCMSYSRLKGMSCPAKVKYAIDNPMNPTEAMLRGSAFDCLVLTPDRFESRFVVADECCAIKTKGDKCDNPGTVRIAGNWYCGVHLRTKGLNLINRNEVARFEVCLMLIAEGYKLIFESPSRNVDGIKIPGTRYFDHPGGPKRRVSDHPPTPRSYARMVADQRIDIRIDAAPYGNDDSRAIVPQAMLDTCLAMRDAVERHKEASALLAHCTETQLTGVFNDPDTGALCKMRPDIWCGKIHSMADLKATSEGADKASFKRTIKKRGYHIQAAFYPYGMEIIGQACEDFAFIAVEVEPPHVVGVHRVGPLTLEAGRNQLREFKRIYAECYSSGEWPAIPGISDVEMSDFDLQECGITRDQIRAASAA